MIGTQSTVYAFAWANVAMGVALVGVLGETKETPLLPYECAELASSIEKHELGILGGKQDHYASAIGGINLMEFSPKFEIRDQKQLEKFVSKNPDLGGFWGVTYLTLH